MPEKICNKCGKPKDLETGFSRDRTKADGRQSQCKACNNEYRLAHKTRITRYHRAYNKRPSQKAYQKAYAKAHLESRRARHFRNREKNLACMRAYYRKNKAAILARKKAPKKTKR
jgi:hypothetical protein